MEIIVTIKSDKDGITADNKKLIKKTLRDLVKSAIQGIPDEGGSPLSKIECTQFCKE
jgi:hypothetical protein